MSEKLYELMNEHQFGSCHSLTVLLKNIGLGDPLVITDVSGESDIIH